MSNLLLSERFAKIKDRWDNVIHLWAEQGAPTGHLMAFLRDLPALIWMDNNLLDRRNKEIEEREKLLNDAEANDMANFWASERMNGRLEMMYKMSAKWNVDVDVCHKLLKELPPLVVHETILDLRRRADYESKRAEDLLAENRELRAELEKFQASQEGNKY